MSVRKIIVARRPSLDRSCALLVLLAAGGAPALADPADDVFTPYTDIGKWQVAYGLGTEHDRDGARETQQALSLGGTPSARWYTSVYAAWAADDGGRFAADEWAWVNHVALTTPGANPLDVGVLCELARPHDRDEGRLGVTCGPTLQMDTDTLQINVNPSITRQIGVQEPGGSACRTTPERGCASAGGVTPKGRGQNGRVTQKAGSQKGGVQKGGIRSCLLPAKRGQVLLFASPERSIFRVRRRRTPRCFASLAYCCTLSNSSVARRLFSPCNDTARCRPAAIHRRETAREHCVIAMPSTRIQEGKRQDLTLPGRQKARPDPATADPRQSWN